MSNNVPSFKRSLETQEIIAALEKMQPGELVTYADLSRIAGEPISGASGALQSAKRIVENENEFAFAVERKLGIRRLTDEQIVDDTHGARVKICRHSKRALNRLSAIKDFSSLDDNKKRAHQAHAVIYAVVAEKTAANSVKRITSTVKIDGMELLSAIRKEAS
jgi:hypothetical protein